MRWCVGSAKQESLLVCVDGVTQACRDLGCPALSHMYNTCCFWWPLHAGRLWGGHHLCLWAIGRLSWGPRSPDQLRSPRFSQLEPKTASEMPFRNGNSPGARRQLPPEHDAFPYRELPPGLAGQPGTLGTARRLQGHRDSVSNHRLCQKKPVNFILPEDLHHVGSDQLHQSLQQHWWNSSS